MPLLKSFHDGQAHTAIWKIEETEEELLALTPANLRKHYSKEMLERFKLPKRRREWLAVRAIAHSVLGFAGLISYKPTGLPFIEDTHIYISISHSHGFAAMSASERPVGIDIELIGEKALRTRSKFLSPEEEETISAVSASTTAEFAATAAWTAKEAAFKYFAHKSPLSLICETIITDFSGKECHVRNNYVSPETCHVRFHTFGNVICALAGQP